MTDKKIPENHGIAHQKITLLQIGEKNFTRFWTKLQSDAGYSKCSAGSSQSLSGRVIQRLQSMCHPC